jgi:hypothetical protein
MAIPPASKTPLSDCVSAPMRRSATRMRASSFSGPNGLVTWSSAPRSSAQRPLDGHLVVHEQDARFGHAAVPIIAGYQELFRNSSGRSSAALASLI